MPSAPDIEFPLRNDEARTSSGTSSDDGDDDDIFMTIEQPKPLGRKESLQKEKKISVDPSSLKGGMVRQASFTLVSPQHPSAKSPPRLKFVSASLPCSASSSPRSGSSSLLKKIWKNENDGSPRLVSRHHSSLDDADRPIDDFDFQQQPLSHQPRRSKERDMDDEGFKCGKLCLFLPRGKGKIVKSSSSSSVSPLPLPRVRPQATISRTVSLERFECESVTNEREPTNLFFDLPLELIRCSVSDMQSPVTAAFVFDKDEEKPGKEPKGVLKKTTSSTGRNSRTSQETRHVRFSTSSPTTYPSSPTCITPRLRKARADFNAFVEAQSS